MQAIIVKYLGPTNTLGSRFKASCAAGSVTIGYDYKLGAEKSADKAALALMKKFDWSGEMIAGTTPNGDRVYVFANSHSDYRIEG